MTRVIARSLTVLAGLTLALPLAASTAGAGTGPAPVTVPDSAIHAKTITIGGAKPQPTTRTVTHWFGTALNPDNSVTYGFNMVGADPALEQSTTITVDITPLNVVIGDRTFSGSDVLAPTLASPVFATDDYATTPYVTNSTNGQTNNGFTTGGALSSGNSGVQLEDATMRSQFDKQDTGYHVRLNPVVHAPVTIVVPAGTGTLIQTARGVVAGDVKVSWWGSQIQNLDNSLGYNDPTHLPLYLTNNVMNYVGNDPANCCVIGFHGASEVVGQGTGSGNGGGNQPIQTFAWASYVTPGFFNPVTAWALQDIHALSHEIAEWADDPFVNNTVEPWLTPTAPQYGCTGVMETGDPVVGIGFAKGANSFEQGPTPNGTQVADGYYHPEDEVFMPWFMRLSPSTSQAVQSGTGGRYTFMGSLNPYPGFKMPATGC
jgi:hypothetical protein